MIAKVFPVDKSDYALSVIDLGAAPWQLIVSSSKTGPASLSKEVVYRSPGDILHSLVELALLPEQVHFLLSCLVPPGIVCEKVSWGFLAQDRLGGDQKC